MITMDKPEWKHLWTSQGRHGHDPIAARAQEQSRSQTGCFGAAAGPPRPAPMLQRWLVVVAQHRHAPLCDYH